MKKIGNIYGLLSGITWALYTIILYTLLNLYKNSKGDLLTKEGIIFILLTTILISIVDMSFSVIFELMVLKKYSLIKELKKVLFSKQGFGIIPAAILAGPFGLLPYAIASSESASVAGALSSLYPVIGAIATFLIFKEKLGKIKILGGLISILGVVYINQFEFVNPIIYIIALIPAFGWGLEAVFGYKLMKNDVNPIVTITIRHIYSILILILSLLVILFIVKDYSYVLDFYRGIEISSNFNFIGNSLTWIVFLVGSFVGGSSYILWYVSMNYLSVAPAMILNISYVLWIPIISMLPPFNQKIDHTTLIGCIIIFIGTSIVILGDLKLNKVEKRGEIQ